MKRYKRIAVTAAVVCMIAAVAGCGQKGETDGAEHADESGQQTEEGTKATDSTQATEETQIHIANDKPVSIYYLDYQTNTAKLVESEFVSEWSDEEDLASFAVMNSTEKSISFDSETEMHKTVWGNDDCGYKIGYEISFEVGEENKLITILSPQDIEDAPELFMGDVSSEEVTGYLGVWLYDDYHQDGGFYIHVEPEDYDDNTLLTSIKLRPTPLSDEISNLKLRAFSYSDELEFDEDGHYNNEYYYEISIING